MPLSVAFQPDKMSVDPRLFDALLVGLAGPVGIAKVCVPEKVRQIAVVLEIIANNVFHISDNISIYKGSIRRKPKYVVFAEKWHLFGCRHGTPKRIYRVSQPSIVQA